MEHEPLRLIEDCLPLDLISERAAREKRVGSLSALHIWWGRKPQVAVRAAIYAALAPAPTDQTQRAAYLRQLDALCAIDVPEGVLIQARRQLAEIHRERVRAQGAGAVPLVVDLFAGGGTIPLEALRLGCATVAGDLNPVAYLIQRCTLDFPQRYPGIGNQVRNWGRRLVTKTRRAVAHLFPAVPLPHNGQAIPLPLGGAHAQEFIPDAYLWTRTVSCPDPGCGASVPLTQTTMLAERGRRIVALRMEPQNDRRRVRFTLVEADTAAALGFATDELSSRGNARCVCCGATVDSSYVKRQGTQGRMGEQLMAMVGRAARGQPRTYIAGADVPAHLIPDLAQLRDEVATFGAELGLTLPDELIYSGDARAFTTHLYGLQRFGDLFTGRQGLVLLHTTHQLRLLHQEMLAEGLDDEQARVVSTYLALLINKLADLNSSICRWIPSSESVANTFARQAIPMTWNFAEIYPFGDGWGNLDNALTRMADLIDTLERVPAVGNVQRSSAHRSGLPDACADAVISDPPYYDNVPYADLSDYFYVWLKRSIGQLYPEHFGTDLTPKKQEAYVCPARHNGDAASAQEFYRDIIKQSLEEAHRILRPGAPLVLIYAHKTTAGWASIVDALRLAGFVVSEAWPISTESSERLRAQNSAALASSIFIVARKRGLALVGNYTRDVLPELEATVRERVQTLSAAGISGADLVIATVGAGLRAYTRYVRVERDNGDELLAGTFLDEVQRAALAAILEHVVGMDGAGVSAVDPISQYYVLARYQYGAAAVDFDEANVLARGLGVELDGAGSLTRGAAPLLAKAKKQVQLQDYRARGSSRELGLNTTGPTPLIDVLHRLLWLNDHQPTAIPPFLAATRPNVGSLRLVAEALAGRRLAAEPAPGTARDDRTDEQRAIGRLLPVWRRVVEPSQPTSFQLRFNEE